MTADEWELPSEAFEQRQEILVEGGRGGPCCTEDQLLGEEGPADQAAASIKTVTVEDQTSAVVVSSQYLGDSGVAWNPNPIVAETLSWLAERGNIESAVSMYLVLSGGRTGGDRENKVKGLVSENALEHWFNSYVELLQRFQLFTKANEILTQCPLPSVNSQNQNSTTVYSACGACGRNLARDGGAWWCERCRLSPSRCAVCHAVVRGLLAWCQGCGHGGHVHHMRSWMSQRSGCPAGCGHRCEYS